MSTSHSRAPHPAKPRLEVTPYLYRDAEAVPGHDGTRETASRAEQEIKRREAAARASGRQEGEAAARASFDAELHQARGQITEAITELARERADYYQRVESEIVQLALSIARKILYREAQVDPLLLAGMVRVVLDKMENGTKVTVRVPPPQVADFRGFFALHREAENSPEIIEDATLEANHCKLETSLGTTQLGLDVQLKEIENGLMDLLAQRPKPNP